MSQPNHHYWASGTMIMGREWHPVYRKPVPCVLAMAVPLTTGQDDSTREGKAAARAARKAAAALATRLALVPELLDLAHAVRRCVPAGDLRSMADAVLAKADTILLDELDAKPEAAQ